MATHTDTDIATASTRTSPSAIAAVGLTRSFGGVRALEGADLAVGDGQLVALVGPSGSGKSTLLRVIAGFEVPDTGAVWIGDRPVVDDGVFEEPERRGVGMVFQDGALFPHLTVRANVGFGDASEARVRACLELVGLAHRGDDYPHELSGGERQRVALARALAPEPAVVLLDEPFASLDRGLRESLREEVVAILRQAGATALLVTHDQEDALAVADVVAVMHHGRIEQSGTPEEVYRRPATPWVADFLGDADMVPGTAEGGVVDCALGRLPADEDLRGDVQVVLRPEAVAIHPHDDAPPHDATGGVVGRVVRRRFFGHHQVVWLELPTGDQVRCRRSDASIWHPGDRVVVRVQGDVHVLVASRRAPVTV